MTLKTIPMLATLTTAATLALSAGCEIQRNKAMWADGEYRRPTQHADTQAANAARDDGTLYPRHFAGDRLNSLGQTKLSLIAIASKDATDPVAIFFDMPEDAMTTARKDVVTQFLTERGVQSDRVALAQGPNPGTRTLASLTSGAAYQTQEAKMGDTKPGFSASEYSDSAK
jgi:hypothetical protein